MSVLRYCLCRNCSCYQEQYLKAQFDQCTISNHETKSMEKIAQHLSLSTALSLIPDLDRINCFWLRIIIPSSCRARKNFMISFFKKMFKFNVFQSGVSKATTTVRTWRWKVWKKPNTFSLQ